MVMPTTQNLRYLMEEINSSPERQLLYFWQLDYTGYSVFSHFNVAQSLEYLHRERVSGSVELKMTWRLLNLNITI